MAKNKFRPIPEYSFRASGNGTAAQIISELKAIITEYEKEKVIPTGGFEGPALIVSIEAE